MREETYRSPGVIFQFPDMEALSKTRHDNEEKKVDIGVDQGNEGTKYIHAD